MEKMKRDVIDVGSIIKTQSGELRVNGGSGQNVYCSQYGRNPRTGEIDMYECERVLTLKEIGCIMKETDGQDHSVVFKEDEGRNAETVKRDIIKIQGGEIPITIDRIENDSEELHIISIDGVQWLTTGSRTHAAVLFAMMKEHIAEYMTYIPN